MDKTITLKNGMIIEYSDELIEKLKDKLEVTEVSEKEIISFFRNSMQNALEKGYLIEE